MCSVRSGCSSNSPHRFPLRAHQQHPAQEEGQRRKRTVLLDGNCIFDGDCNKYCTIYRVLCRLCGDKYIGNTQQMLKARFQDGGGCHYNVTKNHANGANTGGEGDDGGTGSTTLSSHLVPHIHIAHYPRRIGFSAAHVWPLIFVDAIWEGDIIGCMKTFRMQQCVLCMKERYHIYLHALVEKTRLYYEPRPEYPQRLRS